MGGCWGDFDRDGDLDLYVCPWNTSDQIKDGDIESDRLFRNRGDGTFEDVSDDAGFGKDISGMGVTLGDFDADGWLDFYVGNGGPESGRADPNALYHNNGDGTFDDVAEAAGVASPARTHGMGVADYDRDGDLDLYISNGAMQDAEAEELSELFLNESPQVGKTLKVFLEGAGMNRFAVGAEVTLEFADGRRQLRMVTAGLGFGSQNPFPLTFGLGHATPRRLVVKWPRGARQVIEAPFPGLSLRLLEDGKKVESLPPVTSRPPTTTSVR